MCQSYVTGMSSVLKIERFGLLLGIRWMVILVEPWLSSSLIIGKSQAWCTEQKTQSRRLQNTRLNFLYHQAEF